MSKRIKIMFSIILFIVLIFFSNTVKADTVKAYEWGDSCWHHLEYEVKDASDNVKWEYNTTKREGDRKDTVVKVNRLNREEAWIEIEVYYKVIASGITINQDTYIADSDTTGSGRKNENVCNIEKLKLSNFTVEKISSRGGMTHSLPDGGESTDPDTWYTLKFYLDCGEDGKIDINKEYKIYARGYQTKVPFVSVVYDPFEHFKYEEKADKMMRVGNVIGTEDATDYITRGNVFSCEGGTREDTEWKTLEDYNKIVKTKTISLKGVTATKDFYWHNNNTDGSKREENIKKGTKYDYEIVAFYIQDDGRAGSGTLYYRESFKINEDSKGEKVNDKKGEDSQKDLDKSKEETENRMQAFKLSAQDGVGREGFDNGFDDVLTNTVDFKPKDTVTDEDAKDIGKRVSIVLTIITNIGMILAVLMIAILGVKYMLGSVEEKADYKKDMVPYLVGAFLLFGITTIVKVLQQFGESFNT